MRRRTWRTLLLIGAVASVPASHLQAGPGTWTGWITDVHCDVNVPKAEHVACVAKGLNEGIARLHVYDAKTRKRYLLNDQKRATPYAGRFVTVAGDMQEAVGRHPQDLDGVIAIAAIAPAPELTLMLGDIQGDAARDIVGPASTGPKVLGTDAAGRGASVSATPGTSTAARTGGGGLTDSAKPATEGSSGAGASGLRGRPTNVLGARGDELRRWIPSLAEAIGVEIGAGLGAGTIAEIDGALRGIYQSGRIGDFDTYVESAVVVMGGRVTRRTRTAVQARFPVAGGTLVDVEHKPRGEVWFFVRPDPERP